MKIIKKFGFSTLFILLLMTVSCIDTNPKTDEHIKTDESSGQNIVKTISEVILVDNGAVVPQPMTRRVSWALKNPETILLSYTEQNGDNLKSTKSDIPVSGETHDEVREEIERIAELANDGIAIKPGKQPCVGMNSLNVAVIYNTGDTSRIAISGSVRCDPSLYPSVWALDSLGKELFSKSKPQ
jgi:hypothetical protein